MTTTSVLSLFNSIPKFDGTNWVSFKKDIEVYFELEGNWEIVSGVTPRPADPDEGSKWDAANKRTYSLLYFLILPDFRSLITDISTGTLAWKALKNEFEKDASATRLALRNQFYSIQHDPSKPIATFIESVLSIARQLKAIGREPGKDEVEDIILLRLDKSYDSVRSALITREKPPKLSEIIAAVKEYGISQAVIQATSNATDFTEKIKIENLNDALVAAYVKKRGSGNGDNSREDFDWGNTKGREDVCFRCGRSGHIAAKCFADMPKEAKDRLLHAHIAVSSSEEENFALLTYPATQDSGSVFDEDSESQGVPKKRKYGRRRRRKSLSFII